VTARPSVRITPALLRRLPLPEVKGVDGKEGRGCVLVVGGSDQIPGAVILAATAALRAGAGKLQIATSRRVAPWVAVAVPEARVIGLRQGRRGEVAPRACDVLRTEVSACDALLIGPGMMDGRGGAQLVRRCAAEGDGPPLIVDAAALEAFSDRRRLSPPRRALMILTPHAGEMASLWQIGKAAVLADPMAAAQEAAGRLGAVVALKGAQTYVAAPDGTTFHNTAGNSGLGTSGSGDTLSGIIAGLCARGADPLRATVWGVYLHACAGDALARQIGPCGFLARELLGEIPRLLARLGPHRRAR
jgi:ADP-dependent NAD(P)H-hydrate dehydratase